MSELSNLDWAIDCMYSDDDQERLDARKIIVDLELAEPWEFAEYRDSEELFEDEIRSRARHAGYGDYVF